MDRGRRTQEQRLRGALLRGVVVGTIVLGCAIVVATAAGEPVLGAIFGVPALADLAARVVTWLRFESTHEDVTTEQGAQAERLAAAVNSVDDAPDVLVAVWAIARVPYLVRRGKPAEFYTPLSLVRTLDGDALRGFAALLLGRLVDPRPQASRSAPRLALGCVVGGAGGAIGAVLVPHGYFLALAGALASVALSTWVLRNALALSSHDPSVRDADSRADDAAVALVGGPRPVIAALHAISTWQRNGPGDSSALSRGLRRFLAPIGYDWQVDARARRLMEPTEAPGRSKAVSLSELRAQATQQPAPDAGAPQEREPTRPEKIFSTALAVGGGIAIVVSVVVVHVFSV